MLKYMPSLFFFRQAIKAADSLEEMRGIAEQLVRELQNHKDFIEALGHEPPVKHILESEALAKGLTPSVADEPLSALRAFLQ